MAIIMVMSVMMMFFVGHDFAPYSYYLLFLTLLARSFYLVWRHQCAGIIAPCISFIGYHISKILIVKLIFERNHSCALFTIHYLIDVSSNRARRYWATF